MTMAKPFLVIKTGCKIPSLAAIPGDYEDWILSGMGVDRGNTAIIAVNQGGVLPPPDGISGVAITGSGAMVTDGDDWIEDTATWLKLAVEQAVPVLGICFGHQLLAHALGGRVGWNPNGVEVGSVTVTLSGIASRDPLFSHLPKTFPAQLSHRQSVLELPAGARRLAHSEMEPNQAFAYGEQAWGVQFHPEFDEGIVQHFIRFYDEILRSEGKDHAGLLKTTCPSIEASGLLAHFAALVDFTG